VPPHEGRGGWTWYTGSAGWTYRVAVESVLGLSVEADALVLDPRIPADWPGFTLRYRDVDGTTFVFDVRNPDGVEHGVADAEGADARVESGAARVPRLGDGQTHEVVVTLGGTAAGSTVAAVSVESSERE
jgi:cyclic beta-1,2-glucan synthetase